MEFLTWFFLESSLALGATLVIVLFVLLVHWRRTLRPKPLIIGLILAVALLIVEAAVVTQREHADFAMQRIETAVLESKPQGIDAELSDQFLVDPPRMDRALFAERVQSYMQQIDVRTLRRLKLQVTESASEAFTCELSYLADIAARNFSGTVTSRWRIRFVREAEGWRIVNIIPVRLNAANVRGWDELR